MSRALARRHEHNETAGHADSARPTDAARHGARSAAHLLVVLVPICALPERERERRRQWRYSALTGGAHACTMCIVQHEPPLLAQGSMGW
ncbi:hypothetical protein M441DRAFT_325519 [Trichoderma asperellum CBS 433.97]|uniref:Uncharacterized protein n=1 Tax=Trichoderma asperellum (strain ATCC 204424 / CBS 433.97 / NBRC 101777) TaxID=1042311 RepID=A0A2T3ZLY8_TRIA4|nr:hypothetical protein M441DRAFT_325519 [Trichoderma asperellum CBS 433.97]PTB45806.1 hypothetical protein M441DRAFT_325519 [Trichoderma asperellum CBS 433.97]